jgi:hypothetical protein
VHFVELEESFYFVDLHIRRGERAEASERLQSVRQSYRNLYPPTVRDMEERIRRGKREPPAKPLMTRMAEDASSRRASLGLR